MDSKALESRVDAWAERNPTYASSIKLWGNAVLIALPVVVIIQMIGVFRLMIVLNVHPVFTFQGLGMQFLIMPMLLVMTAWSVMVGYDSAREILFHKNIERKYNGPILGRLVKIGPGYIAAISLIGSGVIVHSEIYGGNLRLYAGLMSSDTMMSTYAIRLPIASVLFVWAIFALWFFYIHNRRR